MQKSNSEISVIKMFENCVSNSKIYNHNYAGSSRNSSLINISHFRPKSGQLFYNSSYFDNGVCNLPQKD